MPTVTDEKSAVLDKTLAVRVDKKLADRLEALARREDRTPGNLHRIILEKGVADRERKARP